MNQDEIELLGQRLAKARTGQELAPRRDCDLRRIDSDGGAAAVQAAAAIALGLDRIGHGLAATTRVTSRLLRCHEPIIGPIFSEDRLISGSSLRLRSAMLGVGAGYAFVFGRSYPAEGEDIDRSTVLGAIASCHIALQVLGRRVPGDTPLNDWTATADFGLAEAYIEGPRVETWRDRDLSKITILLRLDSHVCASGRGSDTLGDPLEALAWLAHRLEDGGGAIEAGDIVASGSCTGLVQMTPGTVVTGDFEGLGTVELRLA